jgi:hypothetical protein
LNRRLGGPQSRSECCGEKSAIHWLSSLWSSLYTNHAAQPLTNQISRPTETHFLYVWGCQDLLELRWNDFRNRSKIFTGVISVPMICFIRKDKLSVPFPSVLAVEIIDSFIENFK